MKNQFKILVSLIIILSLSLIGCESNSSKTSNQAVNTNSQIKTSDIVKYKGSYVGDNSSVGNVIGKLPANMYSAGFSLETKKQPYGIIINYKANQSLGEEDYYKFWSGKKINEFLEKNAVVLLSLIENADFVEFHVDNIGEKTYKYDRKGLEQKYSSDLENLFKDGSNIYKFLNS
ncbi:DUF4825 domain-containing protein [Candidatus Clostridium radicumherbarum]|uniref:DUF4825 domain-containing protein n=1 Tax=Candidatus Clostridium radicumherbarum TaxID=3381662 RepID=A0ABW8TSQ9_9CLOT